MLVTASREFYVPPHGDTLRETVEFVDASNGGELYPPADNPMVLTVGDAEPSSSIGPTLDGRVKPDVIVTNSRADFTDGQISTGSSNAAAFVAGAVVVLKAAVPSLRSADLLRLAARFGRSRRRVRAAAVDVFSAGFPLLANPHPNRNFSQILPNR